MKTIFTHEEIREFIMSKAREVQGEVILLEMLRPKPEDQYDYKRSIDKAIELGRATGIVDAKYEFIKQLADFFEIVDDE